MAMMMGKRSGGRRRRVGGANTDINMTPMIDVMLVLLIVFMVTAPMMTTGVPVDLPKTDASTSQSSDDSEPLVITLDKHDKIYLQDTQMDMAELIAKLKSVTAEKPDQRIFIRGDQALNYGKVMTLMGQLTAAGFSRVALVAETNP